MRNQLKEKLTSDREPHGHKGTGTAMSERDEKKKE